MRNLTILAMSVLLASCAARPVDRVALPAAPPPGEPANMVGLSSGALKTAYGAPAFTRKDGDMEMWRYDGAACRAFFFLYPDRAGLTVRHVETQPRPSNSAFDESCLAGLRRAPAKVS